MQSDIGFWGGVVVAKNATARPQEDSAIRNFRMGHQDHHGRDFQWVGGACRRQQTIGTTISITMMYTFKPSTGYTPPHRHPRFGVFTSQGVCRLADALQSGGKPPHSKIASSLPTTREIVTQNPLLSLLSDNPILVENLSIGRYKDLKHGSQEVREECGSYSHGADHTGDIADSRAKSPAG